MQYFKPQEQGVNLHSIIVKSEKHRLNESTMKFSTHKISNYVFESGHDPEDCQDLYQFACSEALCNTTHTPYFGHATIKCDYRTNETYMHYVDKFIFKTSPEQHATEQIFSFQPPDYINIGMEEGYNETKQSV